MLALHVYLRRKCNTISSFCIANYNDIPELSMPCYDLHWSWLLRYQMEYDTSISVLVTQVIYLSMLAGRTSSCNNANCDAWISHFVVDLVRRVVLLEKYLLYDNRLHASAYTCSEYTYVYAVNGRWQLQSSYSTWYGWCIPWLFAKLLQSSLIVLVYLWNHTLVLFYHFVFSLSELSCPLWGHSGGLMSFAWRL